MGRKDLPAYVDTALQEAVVNAVVHRDYEVTGSQIIIRIFLDRIEIQNPGGLHNTLTEEALYTGCQPVRRNQLLAGFMRDFPSPVTGTSFMEARGEGFLNLVRDSMWLSGKKPKIERIGEAVKLTIYAAEMDNER
jgi:predicted HTH transcriptional regulator